MDLFHFHTKPSKSHTENQKPYVHKSLCHLSTMQHKLQIFKQLIILQRENQRGAEITEPECTKKIATDHWTR